MLMTLEGQAQETRQVENNSDKFNRNVTSILQFKKSLKTVDAFLKMGLCLIVFSLREQEESSVVNQFLSFNQFELKS